MVGYCKVSARIMEVSAVEILSFALLPLCHPERCLMCCWIGLNLS